MPQTRVSILSDDLFFREGLKQQLRADPSLLFIDNDRAITAAPDILLVDSRMDGALDHCAKLGDRRPYRIFLTVPNDAWAVNALAAGARGIVRKAEPPADVVRAIRTVHSGSVWAPRHVVVDAWLRHRRGSASPVEHRLSDREAQVVRCVVAGMSNKDLALQLGITMATVKAHLTRIFQKLGVHGRGELIAAYHGTLVPGARDRFETRRLA